MNSALRIPTAEATEVAREALRQIQAVTPEGRVVTIVLRAEAPAGSAAVPLPREAFDVLIEVLDQMARGHAVTVVATAAELTTQEAAEVLHVSRPFLVGLLDAGQIPCRKVGSHRRVRVADVLAYRAKDDAARRAALDALTAEGQGLGMGY